ncbi:MAG TPA: NADP-dependent oxidoreductase [Thermoleophilaceae bacterium]
MRAIQVTEFGGPEVLSLVEVPRPTPISTEVLVEVHAAGVNPVDWKTRRGSGVSGWAGSPPFGIGWDVAGVVVDSGYGVTTFAPGDRVFGMPWFPRVAGAYSEFVAAPSRQFARMPEGMAFEEAAALPLASLTAWQALVDTANVAAGTSVLVHGASGGVGHLAVQIAEARGASVIATGRAAPVQDVDREVDVVLDLVGGEETRATLGAIRDGGLLVAIATGSDDETKADADKRAIRVADLLVEPDGHALGEIAALVNEGRLKVRLARTFPLEEAARAHESLEAGGVHGKIVLRVK